MPRFNGRGSLGLGPMTGRGLGYCTVPLPAPGIPAAPYGYAGPVSSGYPYAPWPAYTGGSGYGPVLPYAPFIGWPRFGMRFGYGFRRGWGRGMGWGRSRGRGRWLYGWGW